MNFNVNPCINTGERGSVLWNSGFAYKTLRFIDCSDLSLLTSLSPTEREEL